MKKQRYFYLVVIVLIISLLVGCALEKKNVNSVESSLQDSKDYVSLIEDATTVKVKERFISLRKIYDVYVDEEYVGSVSGKYVNVTGDVFTFTDADGNKIAKEKQIKRCGIKLNRLAHLMDQKGNTTGYIGEEYFTDIFSLSDYNFHIYDKNKNELGYTKEKLISLLYEFNVYDTSGDEILFSISKHFDMVDYYKIVKQKDSEISMRDIIFLTCIIDAIEEASN